MENFVPNIFIFLKIHKNLQNFFHYKRTFCTFKGRKGRTTLHTHKKAPLRKITQRQKLVYGSYQCGSPFRVLISEKYIKKDERKKANLERRIFV